MKKLPLAIALSLTLATFVSFSYAENDSKAVPNSVTNTIKNKTSTEKQKRLIEGKRYYEQVCYECHMTGFNGAPKLGNMDDWKEIRQFGKTALLESVIVGKGLMPRQGGSAEESKSRYRLMVEYMLSTVNADNIETTPEMWEKSVIARHLSNGKTLYNMVCNDCHATGANGAPKISDKAAWEPRVQKGLDALTKSAIKGHGNMLPLGGSAIQSIEGVREMVAYMLDSMGYKPKK